jgi:hypothetical protein
MCLGSYFYPETDPRIRYEGEWKNGERNGKGYLNLKNNKLRII